MITEEHLQSVATLETQRSAVAREAKASGGLIRGFLHNASGGLERSHGEGKVGRTATAFSVFALSHSNLLQNALTDDQLCKLKEFLLSNLAQMIEPLPTAEVTRSQDERHINSYSVPIWLTGIFHMQSRVLGQSAAAAESVELLTPAVESIVNVLRANDGFLPRVLRGQPAPSSSAYLTFWGVNALTEALGLGFNPQDANIALLAAARWSESELARLIACHHAAIPQRFDVVECLSAASIALRLAERDTGKPNDDIVELALHAVGLALDHYFVDGSFRLSRPVFSDTEHYTVLCSTAEVLMILLGSLSPSHSERLLSKGRLQKLIEAFEWCSRNKRESGIPPDYDATLSGEPETSAFSTCATLAFYALLTELLDDAANRVARDALDIPVNPPDGKVFGYPDEKLADAVQRKIVAPLSSVPQLKGKHSIILHGPPGTAKTSIAKRIAVELGWPLKTITQSDFLKAGQDKIDAEAGRIFSLCLSLKNVVLLFDELEELILSRDGPAATGQGPANASNSDRESRLLTTSMLPKIHELRDRERLVFIFATNRLTEIDAAATRLGRFDMIKWVGYPEAGLLGDVLIKGVADLLEQQSQDRIDLAIKIARDWRPLIAGEPLITFVEMMYC